MLTKTRGFSLMKEKKFDLLISNNNLKYWKNVYLRSWISTLTAAELGFIVVAYMYFFNIWIYIITLKFKSDMHLVLPSKQYVLNSNLIIKYLNYVCWGKVDSIRKILWSVCFRTLMRAWVLERRWIHRIKRMLNCEP